MGRGSSGISGGGAGGKNAAVNVGKAYNDILNGNATLETLATLQPLMNIDKANFTVNGNSVKMQNVTIQNGNQTINLTFNSQYEPTQTATPTKNITTKITARVWENGNIKGIRTIKETSTKSLKNAAKQYDDMLSDWKKLTKQSNISF